MPSNRDFFCYFGTIGLTIAGIGAGLVYGGSHLIDYMGEKQHHNKIPKGVAIENEFVNPSDLEIKLEDRDNNGKNETVMKIKGKEYALIYENENPVLKQYRSESKLYFE